ncbi:MAG: DUF4038 domain-containing protein [Runella sp.]
MKKILFIALTLCQAVLYAQITDLTYPSALNGQDIAIKVYLPPQYTNSTERFPVVYNLHGGGGSPERQWDRTRKTLTDAIENKRVKPMIYVFVNGLGNTNFVNNKDGKQIERSIVEELIPFIDRNYRTIANRTGRAIDGFSMGGYGALMVAFRNPTLFSSVVSYGAALVIGASDKNYRDAAHFAEYDPRALTIKNRAAILKNLKIRMVCGDSDWLFTSNVKFKAHLDSLKIPVDWVIEPGLAHCTQCLYENVGLESLRFMASAFEGKPYKAPKPLAMVTKTTIGDLSNIPFRPSGALPRLKVSENKRFLVTETGRPFFWLNDTAWLLCSKADREEVDKYFENRAAQQFSSVMTMLLPWQHGGTNIYGEKAFENDDFTKPNKKYWQHIDYIVDQASAKGLYLGLVVMWSINYIDRKDGKIIITEEQAYQYGKFLGNRYNKALHVYWVLGGDTPPKRHEVFDAMAKGIIEGVGGDPDMALITFHPPSPLKSSGAFYHDRPWLDFNILQSGHDIWRLNYESTVADYARTPTKPVAEGEPCYEDHPVRHKYENGAFTDWHIRMRAYWSLFAGGFGFTYGGNGVWQWDKEGQQPFLETHHRLTWDKALSLPGAEQMRYVRALIESRPYLSRLPDDGSIVSSALGEKELRTQATFGEDRTWAMIYLTSGQKVSPNFTNLRGKNFNLWWFNPRTGQLCNEAGQPTGKPFQVLTRTNEKIKAELDPPGEVGQGNDWILVIDDAARNFPPPGTRVQ